MTARDVIEGRSSYAIDCADCLDWLARLPDGCCSLTFCSPPYEQARLYLENGQDIGIARDTEAWVEWTFRCVQACLRVTTGLVAFVVAGQTKDFRWSAGPALLVADLCRAGVVLRNPPIYHRVGIPGSGGPDWLRNDYEWIICCTSGGKLPWSDPTAMGHAPKWAPGGEMSNRKINGARVNQWGMNGRVVSNADGTNTKEIGKWRPSHKLRRATSSQADGDMPNGDSYDPPAIANPGNVIKCNVGGGLMDATQAHENEAPFPEKLAEFFIRSFAPEGSIVCDPFSGSGTTAAVAVAHNRRTIACDIRQSQVDLGLRRIANVTPAALFADAPTE